MPKALHSKAHGRAAHPRLRSPSPPNPDGVLQSNKHSAATAGLHAAPHPTERIATTHVKTTIACERIALPQQRPTQPYSGKGNRRYFSAQKSRTRTLSKLGFSTSTKAKWSACGRYDSRPASESNVTMKQ